MKVLLYLFDPVVDLLRGLQQASELSRVQKKLGCSRASLSDATDIFEPERLREIVEELSGRVHAMGQEPAVKDVRRMFTAADGTLVSASTRLPVTPRGMLGRGV